MCPDRSGRLGTFLLLLVLATVRIESLPVTSLLDDDTSDYDDFYDDDDYDVVFDQRQNGTANVHLSVDGVMVAVPAPEMPPSAALAGATLLDLFASQLAAAGGESEDSDSSEESDGGVGPVGSSPAGSTSTSTSTTTTTSTTTVAPAAGSSIASDFPYQTLGTGPLPVNLPASLLGQGLSFLFNTKRAEIPFRVNAGAEPANPAVLPVLITKVEKAPLKAAAEVDSDESNEDSHEAGKPAPQQAPKQHAGKKKRKHKRKYKVRVANLLRPLLQRTVLIQ